MAIDIYQAVTDRILALLDKGTVPWRHPITRGTGGNGFPKNLVSGKTYRGINVFLLAMTSWVQGYQSSYWLTYKQARDRGGLIRKGEKASLVVFWKQHVTKDRESGEDIKVPVLRHYNVFNAQQCDGIQTPEPPEPIPEDKPFEPIAAARNILWGYANAPVIEQGGGLAFYSPSQDTVCIPSPVRFVNREAYYATLFHELAHSTGHSSRLNRGLDKSTQNFGSPDYSKEELCAEMGAAFLAATAGISPSTIEQSAAYIDGWRARLKGDKKLIIQAAGVGQRAADHILGVTWDAVTNTIRQALPENATSPHVRKNDTDDDLDVKWEQFDAMKTVLQGFLPQPEPQTEETAIETETQRPVSSLNPTAKATYDVDPDRICGGQWSHEKQKQVGEGDISVAYSGETIAMKGRIRKPFNFHGQLWACVGLQSTTAEAYRLVHPDNYTGNATTYAEKTQDSEAARNDPNGFYHGMKVVRGKLSYILEGPPAQFIAGQIVQPELFGNV